MARNKRLQDRGKFFLSILIFLQTRISDRGLLMIHSSSTVDCSADKVLEVLKNLE
jgi:hypothetical protein